MKFNLKSKLLEQVSKFGVSGVCATVLHLFLLFLMVEFFDVQAQVANVLAFMAAFFVSFFMNYYWTFAMAEAQEARSRQAKRCAMFFGVALVGLFVNMLWVHLCTQVLEVSYLYAYPLIVLFTPVVTFLFSKMIVFKTS